MPKVVYWVQDLLFVSKIRATCTELGIDLVSARDPDSLTKAAVSAQLVIVDLRRPDALDALDRLIEDPLTRAVPKVGFIDHEKIDVMDAAREKGCRAYAKGKFSSELPHLLSGLVT